MPSARWTLIVLTLLGAQPSYAFDFFYADLADSRRQFVMHETSISAGGPPASAEYCGSSSPYSCFSSGGLKFAVPKNLSSQGSWKHEGATYRIQRRSKFSIVGTSVDAVFFEQVSDGGKVVFVFSELQGLIALTIAGKTSRTFVLENACGFGASASCKQSSQVKR